MTIRVRVGTRRSPLARAQTAAVIDRLARLAPQLRFESVGVETSGDRDRTPGRSPDFTDAIDRALLGGDVDLAVHSAKDLPVKPDGRLELTACPRRANPRDCLVGGELLRGARVGSSSLRRRAQLLRWRPDLTVVEVRGNVGTRIELTRSGAVDAVILAVAGVDRLGRAEEIGTVLPTSAFLPSPAQGALAVVTRRNDTSVGPVVSRIDHLPTHAAVRAERAFAGALGADCNVPLGCLASVRHGTLSLEGEVLSPDGRRRLSGHRSGPASAPEGVGAALGQLLLEGGASELLGPRP